MTLRLKDSHDEVRQFLRTATAPIKSREASRRVSRELEDHIEDTMLELMEEGMKEKEAIRLAVRRMGDAGEIGQQINRIYRPVTDWTLLGLLAIIVGIGLFAMFSISSIGEKNLTDVFTIHSITVAAGLLVMALFRWFDYQKLQRYSGMIYGIGILVLAWGSIFGTTINGSKRFISFGYFGIDAIILGLLFILIALPGLKLTGGSWYKDNRKLLQYSFFPMFFFVKASAYLIFIIFAACFIMLLWIKRRNIKTFLLQLIPTCLVVCAGVLYVYVNHSFSFLTRIEGILSIYSPNNSNYYTSLSIEAIRQAGWWGHGFGASYKGLEFIHTESLFSYMIYSYGWMMGVLIGVTVLYLLIQMFFTVRKVRDAYGRIVVYVLLTYLSFQYIWYIAMCLGLLPVVSVSLPLISFGFTQNLTYFIAFGLILSIYRRRKTRIGGVEADTRQA